MASPDDRCVDNGTSGLDLKASEMSAPRPLTLKCIFALSSAKCPSPILLHRLPKQAFQRSRSPWQPPPQSNPSRHPSSHQAKKNSPTLMTKNVIASTRR
ncbi:jg2386 [Pararge aegeria aegeria]|uniref:Jg2386 protein n=1 Tax=Pararge aegeria aegeria TaxID=348720 RepID=A0A8S4S127_9NEOP|nr:jg2386 [Pararge aegeria aegeria]